MEAQYRPMTSPLQLDRYFLKSLHFTLKPGFDRGNRTFAASPPDVEIGVVSAEQDLENPARWRFEVSIQMLPDGTSATDFPYTIETTVVGYFTVTDNYPREGVERLARANGPALLYSCAREIIASVTGRSPYPRLLIPSVTFIQPDTKPLAPSEDQLSLYENQPKQLSPAGGPQLVNQ